ncbi:hypothetical protein, conserved in P.knowlesi [Plasmodium knowlesi strain H]|uniref:Pv-fam-d protein n=3 Tax=Plasmodium knowlesi TaxID=5850 RepID=A0A5K1V172_PLAKH|nr:uncharacterized protein PKNH_1100400 [Plasmodium knowlesi strain H]OTN64461.1 Uncharacterized protein PKNOH_S130166500 [Plasmodium knowlesi]CAA9988838.1 hypothetical protein, conserved in P.knowlesi [Plasmodium knowlesi strain H]SBO24661.1 hypothetical protein, conserved in P.knowlesi [Plasmodium knowlesi strain H]SBO27947.1 hypothetical protein, conserved in P.knowlesi [Plasmodium knowlesi strain H]VVS78312.1 hypothetical protein, conserved in P.knowlesi [Plasmodium knowlesi strain H]|eukprot:XP_002261185.1 [Plasmodium knowlesi strain H]
MISLRKLPLFIFVVYSWQCSGNYVSALSTLNDDDATSMESLFTKVQKTKFDKNGNSDKLTNYDNSMESLFTKMQKTRFPHYSDDLSTNYDTSMESLFTKVQKTRFPQYSDDLSTNYDTSRESLFPQMRDVHGDDHDYFHHNGRHHPHHQHHHNGHHYDDKSTNYDSSMESLFPERRDFHGDYEDTITTDTYSQKGGYVDKHNYNFGEDFYHVMYKNNGYEKTKAKAKTGVHLPMLDEYPTEEHEYYNNSKNGRRINSIKQKIYRNMPFIRKFFNKIDAKLESEIRRYLNIKEKEKHYYPVRKVNGTRKFFNFLSKYRVFVLLGVVGIVSSLSPVLLRIVELYGVSPSLSLLSGLAASAGIITCMVFIPIYYFLPFMIAALVFGGYDFLVLYYTRKLDKIKRSREQFDKSFPKVEWKKIKGY